MAAILTRSGDAPAIGPTEPIRGLGRALSKMVHTAAERLIWPQRELPREWFHYPTP